MATRSEADKALEAAMATVPRIAKIIAAIPARDRAKALGAAERRYLQTARQLGGGEGPARNWVSSVMRHLHSEVAERDFARQKMLKALLRELEGLRLGRGTTLGELRTE